MTNTRPTASRRIAALLALCVALAVFPQSGGAAGAPASPNPVGASEAVTAAAEPGNKISFPGNDSRPHTVGWNKHTFTVDDKPLHIFSGEIHYWRLPSPQMWRDVFQKMRANGFNAVSLYYFWGYHQTSPEAPFDFSGVKDIDLLMTMAAEEGLYIIARPGPYINAEISMGGLPAWMTNRGSHLRSAEDPRNLKESLAWLHAVSQIIKKHQVSDGGGSLLMYQTENEMFFDSRREVNFQRELTNQVRRDGITVPLFHNDWAPNGKFSGTTMKKAGLDFYSYDDYPIRFNCGGLRFELRDHESKVRRFAPDSPLFVAEGQGGAFTPWGACRGVVNVPASCRDERGTRDDYRDPDPHARTDHQPEPRRPADEGGALRPYQ